MGLVRYTSSKRYILLPSSICLTNNTLAVVEILGKKKHLIKCFFSKTQPAIRGVVYRKSLGSQLFVGG
jgi:hypothetical protein